MKAKKMLTLLISGAMALTIGAMAACDKGGNSGGKPSDNPPDGGYDYTLDNTEYYLAGDGAGTLKQNGWNETDHVLKLVRDEDADHNVFKITIDMYAGDEFQIVHDDSWTGQMGINYMYGVEEGEVKDEEGNVVFAESGAFGGNIGLQPGHDGTYTFSLHTYPDGESDPYITYTKDAELSALIDMYVVSDMNDFGSMQKKYEASHMEKNGDIWKYILEITADDLIRNEDGDVVEEGSGEYAAVAVWNDVLNAEGEHEVTFDAEREPYTFIDGNAFNLLKAGVYTLRYNAETDTLTIEDGALELYFTGSFNEDTSSEDYKLTEDADGNWYGYIKLEEAAQVNLYNKYTESTYDVNGGAALEAGEYFVKFTAADKTAAHEELAYYIAGSFADVSWGIGATSPKLTWDEDDGVYTVDIADVTSLEFKVVYGTVLGGVKDGCWYGGGADGNANVSIMEEGDYTITFNPVTKVVNVTEAVSQVTVSFDLNYPDGVQGPEGQEAPEAQIINRRQTAIEPTEEPTLDDYTFLGWYTDPECNDKFDFSTPVTGDITLYAGWILTSEIPVTPKVTFNLNYTGAPAADVVEAVDGYVTEPQEPERANYYFLGWYTSSAGTTEFNFSNPVTTDTTVYAKWLAIDTHVWHIVGLSSWNTGDLTYTLTHDEDYPKANVFSITLTLYAGNAFKIIGDTDSWANEVGINQVTVINGEFSANDGTNIGVNKSGVYKLILSTDGSRKLTYTFTPVTTSNDIYFQVNGAEGDKLAIGADGSWTGTITVKSGDVIKLIDKNNSGVEYDVNITEAGTYLVKLVISTGTVTFDQYGYYLAGDFGTAEWGINANSPKMTYDEATGKYTIDLVATAGLTFKVVYGIVGNVKDWINSATSNSLFTWDGDGNLKITAAGTYTITIDPATNNITIAQKAA